MALGDITDPSAVIAAVNEFDRIGRERFLDKYGFHAAKGYYLLYRGYRYDSKAIIGAAHGYQHPKLGPLRANEFSGGETTVARKLRNLGFEVTNSFREGNNRKY